MDTHTLITQLELAASRSLYLAEQEKEKALHGAYFPTGVHHDRAVTRENFFRGEHDTILAVLEEVKAFTADQEPEDQEEVIFLARRLIAEVSYPWIRRKALNEELYNGIYKDTEFEPYAKDLVLQQKNLLKSDIHVLGLDAELEHELHGALIMKMPQAHRGGYHPTVGDIIIHKHDLENMFKDGWSQKSNLICFRLYEFGLV
jgi:hypothetical protein